MGHIKEPEGIDFVIKSRLLTKEEEIAISNYILAYKAKHSTKQQKSRKQKYVSARKKQKLAS
jgi:hypothetical protein